MGLYKTLATNETLERSGIWLEVAGSRIKLGRAGGKNIKYVSAMEQLQREHKRTIDLMSDEQGRKLFNKLYAETVVLDWLTASKEGKLDQEGRPLPADYNGVRWAREISGPDDKPIPFTTENVEKVFADLPDLAILCRQTAEDQTLFRQSLLDKTVGN